MRHLLLVEDNEVNRVIIHQQLLSLGYSVQLAVNGNEAVKAFKDSAFDIILMDCEMPVMDGFEATKAIRQSETQSGAKPVPILALTGHKAEDIGMLCSRAGMNQLLNKPISTEELAAALESWLNKA
jgi:CheY-like chemotaxis protein